MPGTDGKVYFIGAGPGDPELLTLKGKRILEQADVVIYADSLVDPRICDFAKASAAIHKSSSATLDEVVDMMTSAARDGKIVARVHTGDPSVYGAIFEQMAALEEHQIEYEVIPGVSSVFAAAAALRVELTVPDVSQTVIITRLEGRTPVPARQKLKSLAAHDATMGIFLSAAMIDRVVAELLEGACSPTTPVAVVYRASWENEVKVVGTLADIAPKVREAGIDRQALILVGEALDTKTNALSKHRSKLYDENFAHGCRRRRQTIDNG